MEMGGNRLVFRTEEEDEEEEGWKLGTENHFLEEPPSLLADTCSLSRKHVIPRTYFLLFQMWADDCESINKEVHHGESAGIRGFLFGRGQSGCVRQTASHPAQCIIEESVPL